VEQKMELSAGVRPKPAPPSAIATISHGSIRTGALPMICEPGDSAATGGELLLERRAGLVAGEDVAALEPLARHACARS
jgi:hypothetical protein